MDPRDLDPSYEARLLDFARSKLGPASAAFLAEPAVMEEALRRLVTSGDVGGAVLPLLFTHVGTDSERSNEFAAYVLDVALRKGRAALGENSRLRKFVNTSDLANSVLANIWPQLDRLSFKSEEQFATLLFERMDFKARDHAKRLRADKRREDLRLDVDPRDVPREAGPESDPVERAVRSEQRQRVQLLMGRLTPQQRAVLERLHEGQSRKEIAAQLGVSEEAIRQIVIRAITMMRDLMGLDGNGPPP